MNTFEIKILDFIQKLFGCKFLDVIMPVITKLADNGFIWILLALLLICFKKTRPAGLSVATALLMGFLLGNVMLKNIVARIRPYDVNTSVNLLINRLNDYSFPSGHTLASFEAATALFMHYKKGSIAALILASAIAFSRIYLYVHYPSDVLFSIVLGLFIGWFASKIINNLYHKKRF